MPKYYYTCTSCGKEYVETRLADHPQFFTQCGDCKIDYVFVKEEPNL